MKSFSSETGIKHVVEVNWADRWQVYQRLRELEIPSCCETNQPLQVQITSPQVVVQLWSVMRQFTASRQELICTLEHCWRSRYQKF
ncbi:Asr1405/Asl0597 family protein [Anabaena sp. WFMT]|uniref:Asr1405/Asl0597 family protein n=1 Tax=Anabaena sp. WFMT TaxID=3449730 RepID=UPI003F1E6AD7